MKDNQGKIIKQKIKELKSLNKELGSRNYIELYSLYATCERSFIKYNSLLARSIACKDDEKKTEMILERFSCRDIVIVFSHLFLEAVIYDYGAINTSGSYMKKYVDKLDFLAKWVVVPRLVTGNSFPTGSQAYELLGKLVKARNGLVHFKTKQLSEGNLLEDMESMIEGRIHVSECFDCMSEALFELSKLGEKKWALFQWGFVKFLTEKSYKRVEEATTEAIRSSLGINESGSE